VQGRIYSVGYEGLEVTALAERLAQAGVSVLVDVRLNAMSRRPGFSRKALSAAMTEAGIEYLHEPELGNPQDNRAAFRRGEGTEGRRRMRAILSNESGPALARLVELARTRPVAVMCVERDHTRCHRGVITDMVQELEPSIEIVQLL
jgi:uncharacterized protein (DUF488 family)